MNTFSFCLFLRRTTSLFIVLLLLITSSTSAKPQDYFLEDVVSGLSTPWGIDFLSDDTAIITEKEGKVWVLEITDKDAGKLVPVAGMPAIMQVGQGGLLDVKLAPVKYWKNQLPTLFFTYVAASTKTGKSNLPSLFLGKAVLNGSQLQDWQVLFEANEPESGGRHFGSRITFDTQGHVYFSMGDRGQRKNSQDLAKHSGSIFRLNMDGTVPADNPFVGKETVMPEIWSYGHRNPQGLHFDLAQNILWSIEHGPRGGDEINLIEKGKNYGWPVISYGREYVSNFKVSKTSTKEGMEQPVHFYVPSIAPGSLIVYSGRKFPEWQGVLMSGALKLRHLNLVTVDENNQFKQEQRAFEGDRERVRNVVESPNGNIYLATDSGKIVKVVKK